MRYREQRRTPLPVTTTPWPRLITMIGMLAVIFLIINRARDPNTWRWLTEEFAETAVDIDETDGRNLDESELQQAAEEIVGPPAELQATPIDQDRDELEAAHEEFQAITDKRPLLPEEMPSYWRLLSWVKQQSGQELPRRSSKSVLFTNFVEVPDQSRGKLVHLRLHLMRTLSYEAPGNSLGITRLYEAWGWTDEAYPWLYVVVFPDLPPGMPIGPDIREEASFDGYFLKLMSYEAHGKGQFAPLLIGRMVWHPPRSVVLTAAGNWFWPTLAIGGPVLVFAIWRFWRAFRPQPLTAGAYADQSRGAPAEDWLKDVEANKTAAENWTEAGDQDRSFGLNDDG